MATFRVEKSKNYTTISNYHLREKEMSLKSKGLLTLMLSLPDDWNYSIEGLVAICKENETAINSSLVELKKFGYLKVIKKMPNETKSGRFEYEYVVYENKQGVEKQGVENLGVEILGVENQLQLNNNKQTNKEINTKNKKENIIKEKEPKHKYGEYKNVLLTDTELKKMNDIYGEENTKTLIKELDEAKEMKGYSYKSDFLAIKKWVVSSVKQKGLFVNVKREFIVDTSKEDEKPKKLSKEEEKEFDEFMKKMGLDKVFKDF